MHICNLKKNKTLKNYTWLNKNQTSTILSANDQILYLEMNF